MPSFGLHLVGWARKGGGGAERRSLLSRDHRALSRGRRFRRDLDWEGWGAVEWERGEGEATGSELCRLA